MHPSFRQTPPKLFFSIRSTLKPALPAASAAVYPAGPPPIDVYKRQVSHLDHSEHSVNIIITEQGVADLRGKSPKERAEAIIENCAHPDYKQLLWDYLKLAGGKAQTPHAIQAALGMHAELAKSGDMKNTNWAEYAR